VAVGEGVEESEELKGLEWIDVREGKELGGGQAQYLNNS
jgi:hypothetical protein